MNTLIKSLAEQSQLWDRLDPRSLGIPGGSTESRWGEELQEFAELIVRECMRMCDCADVSLLEHNYPKEASGASSVKQFIAEHFGVEERLEELLDTTEFKYIEEIRDPTVYDESGKQIY